MTCCSERKDDSPCYECLLESVQRVRELHKDNNGRCDECVGAVVMEIYPCPTIKALDSEQ
jgi:hypothetical protein